ncbi:FAD-binding oxidoreductase [Sporichthya polymorpha]|uniref:FAD-binding oxidoreductase n=1 Tax=Sporichthya polymorpha TaxID=35751 RepID=UPI0003637785|nr:FAD-binding oxidoreductase [Sporichthya polymorpha]
MTAIEDRATRTGSAEAIAAELRATLRGQVIDRSHPEYEEARHVWNGLIDRYPAVIARCAGVADVVAAVRVAREHRPLLSVRGGGHQVAGSAVVEDGLVIDVSAMTGVHVDPVARTARVQAGARWADVDRATQVWGLVTPGGEVSDTGVAGYTLGGGMGILQRRFGLACDNLRSVEIVTADGVVRTASRTENADLFWALRGGGRGLGVVTSFEFELHPLGPQVAQALVAYRYDEAAQVLRGFRDYAVTAPDTLSPEAGLWCLPAEPVLAPLRSLGTAVIDLSGTFDYVDVQRSPDARFPAGDRYLFTSHFLDELTDAAIDAMVECDATRPTPRSLTIVRTMGGAIDHVTDGGAWAHRGARFNLSIDAAWSDPALDATAMGWARRSHAAMARFANGGVYLNFADVHEQADPAKVFGSAAARLDQVRATYDPDGLFAAAAARP